MYRYCRAKWASAFHKCSYGRIQTHVSTNVYTRACVYWVRVERSCCGKINDLPSAGTIQSAATLYVCLGTVRRGDASCLRSNKNTRARIYVYRCVCTRTFRCVSPMRIDLFPSRELKNKLQMYNFFI